MRSRNAAALWVALARAGITGCAADESAPEIGQVSQDTVTTNLTAYNVGQSVVVSFSGMSGDATDWIALAHPGDPGNTYLKYKYTGGGTSGSVTFPYSPVRRPGVDRDLSTTGMVTTTSIAMPERPPRRGGRRVSASSGSSPRSFASLRNVRATGAAGRRRAPSPTSQSGAR